jgi:hypothetical protein
MSSFLSSKNVVQNFAAAVLHGSVEPECFLLCTLCRRRHWGLLALLWFLCDLYQTCFLVMVHSAFHLHFANFLLGLFFDLEDGSDMFP